MRLLFLRLAIVPFFFPYDFNNWNVSTSTSPRSVSLNDGITGNAINDNVINGSISLDIPSFHAFCNSSSIPFWMSFAGFWLKSPATVSGKVPKTLPSDTSAYPPWISSIVCTALMISSSLSPAAMMLCESCATDVAIAPLVIPYPLIGAAAALPVPRWRSNTHS